MLSKRTFFTGALHIPPWLRVLALLLALSSPAWGDDRSAAASQTTATSEHRPRFSSDNESRGSARESAQQVLETELTAAAAGENSPDNATAAGAAADPDIILRALAELAAADRATIDDIPEQSSRPLPTTDKPAMRLPATPRSGPEVDTITRAFEELQALDTKLMLEDDPAVKPPSAAISSDEDRNAEPAGVRPDEDRDAKPAAPPGVTRPLPPTVAGSAAPEPRKSYFENGSLRSVFMVAAGVLEGPARVYDEDGRLLVEAQYKNNVLEGVAKRYFADGISWREERYRAGQLNGHCTTYLDGRIRFIDSYRNGQKINRKAYDGQGKLEFDQIYPYDS